MPPVPGSVNVALSRLSLITTCDALVAVTVNVTDCPLLIEAGLAEMVTVGTVVDGGGTGEPVGPPPEPPHAASRSIMLVPIRHILLE